jgi:uncharacterized protein YecE (DUF72 family)
MALAVLAPPRRLGPGRSRCGSTGKLRSRADAPVSAFRYGRDLTHGTRNNAKETMVKFVGMADMFRRAQKLGGVLFQFPATFECSPKNEDYLRWAVESLEKIRVVIEFRHARWINDKTMDFLHELNAGYYIVDMPQVRNLPSSRIEATSDIACVRFHGQNKAMWEGKASRDQRYDYEYSDEELKEWVPVIAGLNDKGVKDTYVYFNNHYQGKAAKNARTLGNFLDSFRKGSDVQRLPIG